MTLTMKRISCDKAESRPENINRDVFSGYLMINTEQQRRRSSFTVTQDQQLVQFPRGSWYELPRRPPTPCRVQQRRHTVSHIHQQQQGEVVAFSLPPINESGNLITNNLQQLMEQSMRRQSRRYSTISETATNPFMRKVKVNVCTKADNPYLVLFSSAHKYAVPVAHFKLRQFNVVPVNQEQFKLSRKTIVQDPNNRVNLPSIVFTCETENRRNEWVNLLKPLTHVDENYMAWGDQFVQSQLRNKPRVLAPLLPVLTE